MRTEFLSIFALALISVVYCNKLECASNLTKIDVESSGKEKTTATCRLDKFPGAERLIALGDLHGDYQVFHKLLIRLGLIGNFDEWIGGNTILVQLGDQQDRGSGERAIYRLLYKLQDEAASKGGAVFVILGNHDLLNSHLEFRYVTYGGFLDFHKPPVPQPSAQVPQWARSIIQQLPDGAKPRAWAVAPGGSLSVQIAERQHVALIVGDTLFVHGGISLDHLSRGDGLQQITRINEETRSFLHGHRNSVPDELQGPESIVWMRTYSNGTPTPDGPECEMLYATLNKLGVERMIVGHTVQMPGINSRCGGKVWRVDVGLSAAYGGNPEALQIYHDSTAYVVTSNDILRGSERSF